MYRNELNYSDSQLTSILYDGYGITATHLEFIDTGSFYAFIVNTEDNRKLFLKVYPQDRSLVLRQPSFESLDNTGNALNRFRNEFAIKNLSYCIPHVTGKYYFQIEKLILVLFEYIEGFHPSYSPNQLAADKLANIFIQLHHIPIEKFPSLEKENFNIDHAVGLSKWINHDVIIKDTIFADSMLSFLHSHEDKLRVSLFKLKKLQENYSKKHMSFSITHGDAHHYNVMQTPIDLWLVDWDDLKIAPIERDLWHYENSSLMEYYCKLAPHYNIDRDLCKFYKLQRFFEDSNYYLEQVLFIKNSTEQQSEQDKLNFLNHWGWTECLDL